MVKTAKQSSRFGPIGQIPADKFFLNLLIAGKLTERWPVVSPTHLLSDMTVNTNVASSKYTLDTPSRIRQDRLD